MRGRRRGGLTAPTVPPAIPDTLAAGVAAFLQHLAARAYAQGSLDAHHWALKGFLEWTDSQNLTSPAAFTRATIEDYQLHLHRYRSPRTKEPLVVNTQLARLGAIRRFFAWLCRSGALPANPASDLDLPRKQSRRLPKCLSTEEIDRLLALPNTADPFGLRDRAILELFYATGIRRTEMTKLDHGDYDARACTLLIRHGKNNKSRLLPVGERAAFWLDRYLAESRPLFDFLPSETAMFLSGYGMRLSPAFLGNWVTKLMKKAEVRIHGSCHLLRHCCATSMHLGGADIRFVQEMLGHARLETTQIYTHVNIQALAEVHARCHPHGRLPSDSVPDGSDNSNGYITEPERPPAPPASGNSQELFSCAKFDDRLSTLPAMTAVMPHPAPTLGPPDLGRQGPDDDDPPAGIGTRRRPTRPRSPGPRKSGNTLDSKELANNRTSGKTMHVACYGKRYYEPLTGRWHSKDPIGEKGGVNLYLFCNNDAIVSFDILGMLCPVTFEVSGTPNGTVYRAAKTYPIFDGLLYEVPIYNLIVKKVLKKGQAETEQQSKTFQVIRFMPYLNPSKQKDKRYKLVKDEVAMIGLADTTTYTIPEYKDYELHSTDLGENGAFVLQGTHYIHDGPNDDTEVFGSAGCLEVFGKEGMEALKKIVAEYSESKKNTVTEQLKELASAGLLKAKLEKAQRPAVKVSPLKIQQQ